MWNWVCSDEPHHESENGPTMTCRELIDFLMAYLDGELDPAERAEFDRHLSLCPNCRNYLHSYTATVRLGKWAFASPDSAAPGDVPEDLVKAILAARPAHAPTPHTPASGRADS